MKKLVVSALSALVGAVIGAGAAQKAGKKETEKVWGYSEKHLVLFQMMNQWVKVKQEGKNLASFFEKNGYKRIAVYGMSFAGETLLKELRGTDIEVVYGIDRNAHNIYADIDVITVEENLPSVDVIVVTAITFFEEIEGKLEKKVKCPVISLEDILYEI